MTKVEQEKIDIRKFCIDRALDLISKNNVFKYPYEGHQGSTTVQTLINYAKELEKYIKGK